MGFNIEIAERLKNLPPYLFAEIDKKKKQKMKEGKDIIDLGVGDPDTPTPPYIVDRLCEEVRDAGSHRYPSGRGLIEFRVAISRWYKKRFNVNLDPATEVVALIGSKEGIAHAPLAFLDVLILLSKWSCKFIKSSVIFLPHITCSIISKNKKK